MQALASLVAGLALVLDPDGSTPIGCLRDELEFLQRVRIDDNSIAADHELVRRLLEVVLASRGELGILKEAGPRRWANAIEAVAENARPRRMLIVAGGAKGMSTDSALPAMAQS